MCPICQKILGNDFKLKLHIKRQKVNLVENKTWHIFKDSVKKNLQRVGNTKIRKFIFTKLLILLTYAFIITLCMVKKSKTGPLGKLLGLYDSDNFYYEVNNSYIKRMHYSL